MRLRTIVGSSVLVLAVLAAQVEAGPPTPAPAKGPPKGGGFNWGKKKPPPPKPPQPPAGGCGGLGGGGFFLPQLKPPPFGGPLAGAGVGGPASTWAASTARTSTDDPTIVRSRMVSARRG